jgi:hypothetical protein
MDDRWKRLTWGFGLGVLGFEFRLDRRLVKQISLKEFSEQIDTTLVELKEPLPSKVVAALYEICLAGRWAVEKASVARKNARTRHWRKVRSKTTHLITLLRAYPQYDPEQALRKALGSTKDSITAQRVAQLEKKLSELNECLKRWTREAEWASSQGTERELLGMMDNLLQKRLPSILPDKIQRARVMSAALVAVGLGKEDSTENILRRLRRRSRPKRKNETAGKRISRKRAVRT